MNLYALFGTEVATGIISLLGIFDTQSGAVRASATLPPEQYNAFHVSTYVLNELKVTFESHEILHITPEVLALHLV